MSIRPMGLSPAQAVAAGSGTYLTVAGLSNGTDDTATLNALLVNSSGLPKRVVGLPGQSYKISAPLVMGNNVTVDMSGCKVTMIAGSNKNMVTNLGATTARTVMDGAITSASSTLTSATAAFVSGDVGASVVVWGAGSYGQPLRTTIASVTNATTAVLATTATTTVTAATTCVGARSSDVTVIGGTWDRGANVGANQDGHIFRFRRVDGLTVRGVKIVATITPGSSTSRYGIAIGDATRFRVYDAEFDVNSSGVQVNGPALDGVIRGTRGHCGDDAVALTPNDYAQFNDVYGHISHVLIDDTDCYLLGDGDALGVTFAGLAVKVLGGNSATSARHITIRNTRAQSILSADCAVWIGDDSGSANTSGGLIDDVTVDGVSWDAAASRAMVKCHGTNIKTVKVRGLHLAPAPGAGEVYGVWIPSQTPLLDSLSVGEVTIGSGLTGVSSVVRLDAAVITNLVIDKVQGAAMTYILDMRGSNPRQPGVTRLAMSRIQSPAVKLINQGNGATTAVMPFVSLSDINVAGGTIPGGDIYSTTTFEMSNVKIVTAGTQAFNAFTGTLTFLGQADLGGRIAQGAAPLAMRTFGIPCDVSLLTSKTTGDMATNTSNANTGTLGVGPCVYTGSAWKSLVSGNTF